MTMKELMIGDWVEYGKRHHQCYNICGHTNHILLDNGVITNVSNLEPIPLAKIHLTKNGFNPTNESDTEFKFENGYEIRVEFDEGFPLINIDPCIFLRIEFAERELIMSVKYVHQLQNAMRLMDCSKEIALL